MITKKKRKVNGIKSSGTSSGRYALHGIKRRMKKREERRRRRRENEKWPKTMTVRWT